MGEESCRGSTKAGSGPVVALPDEAVGAPPSGTAGGNSSGGISSYWRGLDELPTPSGFFFFFFFAGFSSTSSTEPGETCTSSAAPVPAPDGLSTRADAVGLAALFFSETRKRN